LHCNRSGSSSSDEPPAVAISNKLVGCVLFQTIHISMKDLVQVLRCSPQWRTRTVNAKMHASVCSCSFPPPIRCYSNTCTTARHSRCVHARCSPKRYPDRRRAAGFARPVPAGEKYRYTV
jgi:hypothetical protein